MACLGATAFEKGPLWWSAHHRQHHRHSDQEGDVHSPVVRSVWWSHIRLALRFRVSNDEPTMASATWPSTPSCVGSIATIGFRQRSWPLSCFLIGGWSGLLWGSGIATLLSLHVVFLVNSACHLWGSTPIQHAGRESKQSLDRNSDA